MMETEKIENKPIKDIAPYKESAAIKDLGFDEPCFGYYNGQGNYIGEEGKTNSNCNKLGMHGAYCTAPTFSQSFRFFREKYNLFCQIQIDRTTEPKFCFNVFQYEYFGNYEEIRIAEWYLYRTPEEAELACLRLLIETVNRKA
jgi:hypothetical protein